MSKKQIISNDNPVMAFINPVNEAPAQKEQKQAEKEEKASEKQPISAKKNSPAIYETLQKQARQETKTKRVQLLIKPSLYEFLQLHKDQTGQSANDYINELLQMALEEQEKTNE